jgi:hypothetical protein
MYVRAVGIHSVAYVTSSYPSGVDLPAVVERMGGELPHDWVPSVTWQGNKKWAVLCCCGTEVPACQLQAGEALGCAVC